MVNLLRAASMLLLGIGICFPDKVYGETTLSLQQALVQALHNNPQLAAAEGRTAEAEGQHVGAALRPNPRITLQTEDIRPSTAQLPFSFVNSTEDYILVGQRLEIAAKRSLRLETTAAAVEVSRFEAEGLRFVILGRVSSAYWSAVAANRSRELLEENLRTYDEDITYTQNRVNEGVAAEADLMRLQLERDRVGVQVLTAKRESDQSLIGLFRAMARSDFAPVRLTDSLESVGEVDLPDVAQVLQTRPELRMARESVVQAQSDIHLQKANGKPDPEIFVGYKRNVGYDTFYGAVQIDLPIHNRNQGNIASAAARLHIAEANLMAVEAGVRADIQSAITAYKDQQALLKSMPGTVVRAEKSEALARAAYREGGIDLLRLLDAERSRIQVQVDYFRALAELRQSIVGLRLASAQNLLSDVNP